MEFSFYMFVCLFVGWLFTSLFTSLFTLDGIPGLPLGALPSEAVQSGGRDGHRGVCEERMADTETQCNQNEEGMSTLLLLLLLYYICCCLGLQSD